MGKGDSFLLFLQMVLIILKVNKNIDLGWLFILLPLIFLLLPTFLNLFIYGIDFITEFGSEDEPPSWRYLLNYIIVILQVVLIVLQAKQIIELSWLQLFIPSICIMVVALISLLKLIFLLVKSIIGISGSILLIPLLCLIGFTIIFIIKVMLFIVT